MPHLHVKESCFRRRRKRRTKKNTQTLSLDKRRKGKHYLHHHEQTAVCMKKKQPISERGGRIGSGRKGRQSFKEGGVLPSPGVASFMKGRRIRGGLGDGGHHGWRESGNVKRGSARRTPKNVNHGASRGPATRAPRKEGEKGGRPTCLLRGKNAAVRRKKAFENASTGMLSDF